MPRITLKISMEEHQFLKLDAIYKRSTIKDILTKSIQNYLESYYDGDDYINAISKSESYHEDDSFITVSFEINEFTHNLLKIACKQKKAKLKHLIRGIIQHYKENTSFLDD